MSTIGSATTSSTLRTPAPDVTGVPVEDVVDARGDDRHEERRRDHRPQVGEPADDGVGRPVAADQAGDRRAHVPHRPQHDRETQHRRDEEDEIERGRVRAARPSIPRDRNCRAPRARRAEQRTGAAAARERRRTAAAAPPRRGSKAGTGRRATSSGRRRPRSAPPGSRSAAGRAPARARGISRERRARTRRYRQGRGRARRPIETSAR